MPTSASDLSHILTTGKLEPTQFKPKSNSSSVSSAC